MGKWVRVRVYGFQPIKRENEREKRREQEMAAMGLGSAGSHHDGHGWRRTGEKKRGERGERRKKEREREKKEGKREVGLSAWVVVGGLLGIVVCPPPAVVSRENRRGSERDRNY